MRRPLLALLLLAACAGGAGTAPARPAAKGPEVVAIEAVLGEFARAIVAHDRDALLRIMLDPEVPFRSRDVASGTLYRSTANEFATQAAETKQNWEERFANVVITERDGLAVLDADYQFLVDDEVTNHGREVWTLIRAADGWKITMVTWTVIAEQAPAPKRAAQEDRAQPVTETDLRVLRRADAILASEAVWNRQDTRACAVEDTTWSLYCALTKASLDETGAFDHRGAALQEVRFAVEDATRGLELQHRLMDYNNLASTQFADIKRILAVAIERVTQRLRIDTP